MTRKLMARKRRNQRRRKAKSKVSHRRLDDVLGQLRREYKTQEPDLLVLKRYAANELPAAEARQVEDMLVLRADLRALVHEMRHPAPELKAAGDRILATLKTGKEQP